MTIRNQPITIFTPSFADENNTNAQNLTVKEIVARLPPQLFRVIMISADSPDPRLAARPNTELVRWGAHGNSAKLMTKILQSRPDIYFFPRYGLLDRIFYKLRIYLPLRTALVTYVVMTMTDAASGELAEQSIIEADCLCANSCYVAETISQRFGVDSKVIYDGIDERFFFPGKRKDRPDPPVVLYVGSFQPRKRVELVIEQAIRLREVHFRFVGEGETLKRCRTLAAQHGCENVSFLGQLRPEQVGEEMRRASVFFFPSVIEGHPQVLLQAAACGLPAIAMNCYRPDYVVDGETGFLVESDPELGQRLDLLLCNGDVRQRMSESAVRHARQFNWKRITQQWSDLFLELAETQAAAHSPRILTA